MVCLQSYPLESDRYVFFVRLASEVNTQVTSFKVDNVISGLSE